MKSAKKLKTLLVKPKDAYFYAVIPNLGLGYLASSLRRNNFDVSILDCNKRTAGAKDFGAYLKDHDFRLIGFQLYSCSLSEAKRMIELARAASPDSIIVIGGPHPSGDPEHALNLIPQADCAVIGEGESAVCRLMEMSREDFKDSSRLAGIDNIAFRDGKRSVVVNAKIFAEDLDSIPAPAWDLIDPRTYRISPHGTFSRAYPVAPVITSRGCPYLCGFCAAFQIAGKKIRRRSVQNVLEEMSYLYDDYGVREFHIEDDNFTLDKEYVMRFTDGLLSKGLKVWWSCPNGVRADKLDKEMLINMERSGCYSLAVGVESGSNRVLKMMKKNITVEEIEKSVSLIKATTRMNVTGFFLIGYQGEEESDIQKTLFFSKRLRLDKASFSPVMPLPGSELYGLWKNRFLDEPVEWNKFLYYQFIPRVSEIDENRLKKYIKKAVLQFYLRPRVILGFLREIRTFHQLKVILKRARTVLFGV